MGKEAAVDTARAGCAYSAIVATSNRPQELLASHLGGRRAATLAARVRAWARYRAWLRRIYQVNYPSAPQHVLDYLLDGRAKPCTRITLPAVFSTIRFEDQIMGVPESARWSSDGNVVGWRRASLQKRRRR